jgi:hypothetical protein
VWKREFDMSEPVVMVIKGWLVTRIVTPKSLIPGWSVVLQRYSSNQLEILAR